MRTSQVLAIASGIASLVLLIGCDSAAQQEGGPPPPEVSVAEVVVRNVEHWDEFTGRIEPVESVALRPRVSGYIERVLFTEGGEVAKGDLLFVIDQRTYKAALAQARAELAHARSQQALSQSELARARKLAESRAISTEELEQKAAALDQAKAQLQSAQAAVDVADLHLAFTEVRAPIAGRAGRAMVTAGNLAQADTTLLTTIVSLDPVYVIFEADERTYLRYLAMEREGARLNSNNPVRVALANEQGHPHAGVLDFIDNQVDPTTGTIRARALLPNAERNFTPGMFARVQLQGSGKLHAILVDDKAVLTDQDRKYVYVVGDDGLAQRRDVQSGRMVDGLRVIEHGLVPGDRVIVHGVQKVFFPGMPVQARQIAMGDAPSYPGDPTI